MLIHLLYLEQTVYKIWVPWPFLPSVNMTLCPLFQFSSSWFVPEVQVLPVYDAGKLSFTLWDTLSDFHSVSMPISPCHPTSHSCITTSFHTLNALPSGVWKLSGYLPPSCSVTSASCLLLTAVNGLAVHTRGFFGPSNVIVQESYSDKKWSWTLQFTVNLTCRCGTFFIPLVLKCCHQQQFCYDLLHVL